MPDAPKILCVDDSEEMLAAMKLALERDGCSVATASTASEASRELVDFEPDLILLDLEMPDVDGEELMSVLSEFYGAQGSRTVIFSAMSRKRIRDAVARLGALGALPKPCDLDELGARLSVFLSSVGSDLPPAWVRRGSAPAFDCWGEARLGTRKILENADTVPLAEGTTTPRQRSVRGDVTDFIPETLARHDRVLTRLSRRRHHRDDDRVDD